MALQQLENVYFTEEEIINSISFRDGVDPVIERKLRIFGCELTQDAGILLKLPQVAMATAQVLFHRFYYIKSLKKYQVKSVAMASLFLAAKVEEVPKRARDVLNVFHHLEQIKEDKKIEPLVFGSQKYWDMKKDLIKTERIMLKDMGFGTYVEHPHKFLLSYLPILKQDNNTELAQKAWNYMNDSLREPLCVKFRPEVIASACIYMAARVLQIPLPEEPNPWWVIFDAKQEQLDEIAYTITQLYKEPVIKNISLSSPADKLVAQQTKLENTSRSKSRSISQSPTDKDKTEKDKGDNNPEERKSNSPRESRSHKKESSRSSSYRHKDHYSDRHRDRSKHTGAQYRSKQHNQRSHPYSRHN